jgi:hypothetical protein
VESQASHWPVQPVLQQTPSAQWPVAHWTSAPQAAPAASWVVQTPAEHHWPNTQSEADAQVPRQALAPQTYGAQTWVWTAGQWPPPSQAAARVAVPAAQPGSRQLVVSPG